MPQITIDGPLGGVLAQFTLAAAHLHEEEPRIKHGLNTDAGIASQRLWLESWHNLCSIRVHPWLFLILRTRTVKLGKSSLSWAINYGLWH